MQSQLKIVIVGVAGVIISLFCPVDTFSFKLGSLFYDSESIAEDDRPVFPRRNLEEELGEAGYECLLESSLSVDGGICLNGGDRRSIAGAPTPSPLLRRDNSYGVDVTFPIQNNETFWKNSDGHNSVTYDDFLMGCTQLYNGKCDQSERDRFDMAKNQPPVSQNYTTLGFQKTRAPVELMETLTRFFRDNDSKEIEEKWSPGDTHVNHWDASTYMLNVENPRLKGGGMGLKNKIWKAAEMSLSRWIETKKYDLVPASMYGIRIYKNGAILAPHVDRLPLVTSAIINVAQNVNEPWPLELYAHDGKAYNITLEPGDMLLYESHSIIHGRPFPMKGKYYANIFIHFEPSGHCKRHADRMDGLDVQDDAEELYKRAQRKINTRSNIDGALDGNQLPFFIQEGSFLAKRWMQRVKYARNLHEIRQALPPTQANQLAASGKLTELKKLVKDDSSVLQRVDENGWAPIHEAARGGQTRMIDYLIEQGVDINARTNAGRGGTALWWAEEQNGVEHDSVKSLKKAGAIRIAPNSNRGSKK